MALKREKAIAMLITTDLTQREVAEKLDIIFYPLFFQSFLAMNC